MFFLSCKRVQFIRYGNICRYAFPGVEDYITFCPCWGKSLLGISKNRFFAPFAQSLRPLRLNSLFFNRKVRKGMRKGRKENVQFLPVYSIIRSGGRLLRWHGSAGCGVLRNCNNYGGRTCTGRKSSSSSGRRKRNIMRGRTNGLCRCFVNLGQNWTSILRWLKRRATNS